MHKLGSGRKHKVKDENRQFQDMFHKSTQESEVATEISFQISLHIAKRCKPFTDGDFIKDCFEIASQKICPEAASKFDKIPLSRMTVQRGIGPMSATITDQLTTYSEKFAYFSLAIDESVDITSTTQLLIIVRGKTQEFEIIGELIGMTSLSDQTKGYPDFWNNVPKLI